jgi:DNA replication protein DnaC
MSFGDCFELEGSDRVTSLSAFRDHALLDEEQLSAEDHQRIAALHAAARRKVLDKLPPRLRKCALGTFSVAEATKQAASAIVAHSPGDNLYVHGPAGAGKTMLTLQKLLDLAGFYEVMFRKEADLAQELRHNFQDPDYARKNFLRPDILLIDDLGKASPSDFWFQQLFAIADLRYERARTTIFTANHRPTEFAQSIARDEKNAAALVSRLASGAVIELEGADARTQHHFSRTAA